MVSIADQLLVARQAAAQVVDRLEKDGLVERTPTARGPLVMLTGEGRGLVRG
jgi:DNA-binding MarR family transcriptional regulator